MNRFQVKNLMIQALADEGQFGTALGIPNFQGCPNIFTCAGGISCCLLTVRPYPSWALVEAGQSASSPEDLEVLKRQLRLALARVEQHERALEEQLKPQSLAEVERLEAQHNDALEELRARREELKKKCAE